MSISVDRGEIYALVGENGAGKSTLMRVLSGILTPDSGSVLVDGMQLESGSAKAALEAGVSLVHQELSLVPELTVAENIVLGTTPTRAGFIDTTEMKRIAADALDEIGVSVDLNEPIVRLSVALRQFVEIARAVAHKPAGVDSRRADRHAHAGKPTICSTCFSVSPNRNLPSSTSPTGSLRSSAFVIE